MADLCEELDGVTSNESQEKATALCFCDDVLVFAQDRSQLTKAWRIVKRWSEENHVPINLDKCKLMEMRVDNRTQG